jgi:peptide deformylase
MKKGRGNLIPIRTFGDPVLRTPCRDVETFDELLRKLYEDMLETMYAAPGVGLAAPQIGLALRFFVFDAGDGAGPGAVANPVLSEFRDTQLDDEGCLSMPNLYFPTERSMSVRVEGQDLSGEPISLEGEALLARIFQHETDHVNGMLFIDRLAPEERRKALAMIRERELDARSERSPGSSPGSTRPPKRSRQIG